MFVFQLMGGLGNQMFQYAAARSLSIRRNLPFSVYFEDPYKFAKRQFSLDCFELSVQFADAKTIERFAPKSGISRRVYQALGMNPDKYLFQEKTFYKFDPEFFLAPSDTHFRGFWQSLDYFQDIKQALLVDFRIKDNLSNIYLNYEKEISDSVSVSVHIRRGDYANVPQTRSAHGTCDLSYYERAISLFRDKFSAPRFFLFSDDIEWVKVNFPKTSDVVYIEGNGSEKECQDIHLMRTCKHNIIANSSFSWWAAWLNINVNKIVICPSRWTTSVLSCETELIPDDWIVI